MFGYVNISWIFHLCWQCEGREVNLPIVDKNHKLEGKTDTRFNTNIGSVLQQAQDSMFTVAYGRALVTV